jgi:non-ribosomal peptide synthetase component F
MITHLTALLAAVAGDPDAPLSRLPLLANDERQQILADWSQAALTMPADRGVHELVMAGAVRHPDAVAVVFDGTALTYGGLVDRASRLAWYMRAAGVGPESVVGLCLKRGADTAVAILAVWLAGGAYLPLDPDYPPARLAFMLADSGAVALVGHRAVAGPVAADAASHRMRAVWLDDADTIAAIGRCPGEPPAATVGRAGLAGVIYTSGTTGLPKGTLVTHESLATVYAGWASAHFRAGDSYRWLSVASVSFDVFTGDVVRASAQAGHSCSVRPGCCCRSPTGRRCCSRSGSTRWNAHRDTPISSSATSTAPDDGWWSSGCC